MRSRSERPAAENGDALVAYISGYLDALDWLNDRANREAACAILMDKVPNMTPDVAGRTYDVLLADEGGFEPKAALDREGMQTVLALRSE